MKYNITSVHVRGYMNQEGFILEWEDSNGYFGNLYFGNMEDGKIKIETECMSKKFVQEVLQYLLDNAEIEL